MTLTASPRSALPVLATLSVELSNNPIPPSPCGRSYRHGWAVEVVRDGALQEDRAGRFGILGLGYFRGRVSCLVVTKLRADEARADDSVVSRVLVALSFKHALGRSFL